MLGNTHKIGGICFGTMCVVSMYGLDNLSNNKIAACTILGASLVGSLLPDIDSGTSTISHKLPITSFIVRLFTKHRHLMHTFIPYVVLSILFAIPIFFLSIVLHSLSICGYSLFGFYILGLIGLFVGILSHFLLDMITIEGVAILYPIVKSKISIAKLKGEKHGWIVSGILILVTILYLLYVKNGNFDFIKDVILSLWNKFTVWFKEMSGNAMIQKN